MLKDIIDVLKSNSEISEYIVVQKSFKSKELFFIKDKLDMNRGVSTSEYELTIYKDFSIDNEQYRGSASLLLDDEDSKIDIERKINKALFSAQFVKNNWYELPSNEEKELEIINDYDIFLDFESKYEDINRILFKEYPYVSKVNSCEVFVNSETKRIISSKDVDVKYTNNKFVFEIVTDNNSGNEPVEIFDGYSLNTIDLNEFESIIDKQLSNTDGRSKAVKAKNVKDMNVILSNDAVEQLLKFYLNQASDTFAYQKISGAKLNEKFYEGIESLDIELDPSINNIPVDSEGKILKPYKIFEDSILKAYKNSAKFSYYLNVENKGNIESFSVKSGKTSYENFKKGDYIEILAFSSFLCEYDTGNFGGEFRLAKVKEGEKEYYITNGAISENIFEAQKSMEFSSETIKRKSSIAPLAILLRNVNITGEN